MWRWPSGDPRSGAETPIKTAYREWLACKAWPNDGTGGMDDGEFNDLCDVRRDMERAIYDMQPEGPAAILPKLLVLTTTATTSQMTASKPARVC